MFKGRIHLKGIIIAGGYGTRLSPLTKVISKSLLPVYDKPMIYYPLSILMEAGIREILIITTPQDKNRFFELLGDGSQFGLYLEYEVEHSPKGIGQAFLIGESFIAGDRVALILGDNFFYGESLNSDFLKATNRERGATIFGYQVSNPRQFGVVSFDELGKVMSLEEKPINPTSNYAVVGLYVFDNQVVDIAKSIKPSKRGELEITDINKVYLDQGELQVELLSEDSKWMDMGTHISLFKTTSLIKEIEEINQIKVGCIEEIAYKKGFITKEQLLRLAQPLNKSDYGKHLLNIYKQQEGERFDDTNT